jgi:hypothetical protein
LKITNIVIPIVLLVALGSYLVFTSNFSTNPSEDEEFITTSDEWTFLSVGLYENSTHPCEQHHISCEAEFKSKKVTYRIFNEDMSYLVDGIGVTNEGGFFDLYLPKGVIYEAQFEVDGREGSGIITTEAGASNCITDIRVIQTPGN